MCYMQIRVFIVVEKIYILKSNKDKQVLKQLFEVGAFLLTCSISDSVIQAYKTGRKKKSSLVTLTILVFATLNDLEIENSKMDLSF